MKLKYLLSFFLVVIFLFSALDSDAQRRRRNKYRKRKVRHKNISHYRGGSVGGKFRPYSFVSFNLNALNYYGDLAPLANATSTDISWTRPGAGVNIGYKFSPYAAFRAGFNYGRITGNDNVSNPNSPNDAPRYMRNLSFRNDIKEFQMGFELYFLPNHGGPNVRQRINAYLFVGGAVFAHNPKGLVPDKDYTTGGTTPAPDAGKWVALRPLGTEGQNIKGVGVTKKYSLIQPAIPVAIGAKLRLPGPFDLGFEVSYRFLFTDYLDDVSANYVPFDKFTDPLARIMSDRSAEPFNVSTRKPRDVKVSSMTLSDGVTYYSWGDIGGGIANSDTKPAQRGNPHHNDTYLMTTIRLTWILGKTRRTAKFR